MKQAEKSCRMKYPAGFFAVLEKISQKFCFHSGKKDCKAGKGVVYYNKSSVDSCGAGLAQWMPVNHVRRGTEQH